MADMATPSPNTPRAIRGGGRNRAAVIRTMNGPPVTMITSDDPYMAKVRAGIAYGRAHHNTAESTEMELPTPTQTPKEIDAMQESENQVAQLEEYLRSQGHSTTPLKPAPKKEEKTEEPTQTTPTPPVVQFEQSITPVQSPPTPEHSPKQPSPSQSPITPTTPPSRIPEPHNTKRATEPMPPADTPPRKRNIARLARDRRIWYATLDQKRAEIEEEEVRQYSFKPEVHPLPPKMDSKIDADEPIVERLYRDANSRKHAMLAVKAAVEAEEAKLHTFKPDIDVECDDRPPIHERYRLEQQAKAERLAIVRQKVAEEKKKKENATYRPTINPISRQLVEKRRQNPRSKKTKQPDGATYKPKVSHRSKIIVREKFGDSDFVERQSVLAEKYAKKKSELHGQVEAQTAITGAPEISEMSKLIVREKKERTVDTVERLATEAVITRERVREKAKEDYYAQWSGVPEINPISREIASSKSTHGDGVKAVQAAVQRDFEESHPFKPDMSITAKVGGGVQRSSIASPTRTAHIKKMKEERIEAMKRQKEEDEIHGCTFRPDVDPCVPPSLSDTGRLANVIGLDGYLAQRINAAEQSREIEEIKKRKFLTDVHVRPARTKPTKPQPFTLRGAARSDAWMERSQEVARTVKAAKTAECTFKPDTTTSRQRARIAAILDE